MTTPAEVLKVVCPTCHQKKGEWCVYIYSPQWPEREGQPTKRLHNERMKRAWVKGRAEAKRAKWAALDSEHKHRLEVLRANGQAVANEQQQLIDWLSRYANILITKEKSHG